MSRWTVEEMPESAASVLEWFPCKPREPVLFTGVAQASTKEAEHYSVTHHRLKGRELAVVVDKCQHGAGMLDCWSRASGGSWCKDTSHTVNYLLSDPEFEALVHKHCETGPSVRELHLWTQVTVAKADAGDVEVAAAAAGALAALMLAVANRAGNPTRSLLAKQAAALCIRAGLPREARAAVSVGLSWLGASDEVHTELRELERKAKAMEGT